MEDTLVELKSACAGVMAEARKAERQRDEAGRRARFWADKATLAVGKGRDDLAREALVERRRCQQREDALDRGLGEHRSLSDQYQADIRQLEEKLKSAREKQRMLVQRHIHAERKRRAQEEIRRVDSAEAIRQLEDLLKSGRDKQRQRRAAAHPRRAQAARAGGDAPGRGLGCHLPLWISQSDEPVKGNEIKPPPEFTSRYKITNLFTQFAEEFTKSARDKGVELHWIGVGTWKTPLEIVPEKHLEAWKLSRENLGKGSDDALNKFENETILLKMMTLIQDVPIAAYNNKVLGTEDRRNAMRILLLEYRQQLVETAELMKAKGEAVSPTIRQAFAHIDDVLGLHWVGPS